jgi:hypothetical protein
MNLSDVIVNETESIEATVRWDPKLLPQIAGAKIMVIATPLAINPSSGPPSTDDTDPPKSSDSRFVAALEAQADAPERFSGRLPKLPPGEWQVELQVTGGQLLLKEPVKNEVLVKKHLSAELANVSCNRELLTQLSELSGGAVVEPAEAESLLKLILPNEETQQKIQERTLWDHWLVLVVIFGLLTSEWVIRKLNGLP